MSEWDPDDRTMHHAQRRVYDQQPAHRLLTFSVGWLEVRRRTFDHRRACQWRCRSGPHQIRYRSVSPFVQQEPLRSELNWFLTTRTTTVQLHSGLAQGAQVQRHSTPPARAVVFRCSQKLPRFGQPTFILEFPSAIHDPDEPVLTTVTIGIGGRGS